MSESDEEYQILKSSPYPFASVQLLEITRIQLPQTLAFLTRKVFYAKMKDSNQECCAANPTNSITWVPISDLADVQLDDIWGPELVQYSRLIASNFEDFHERIEEFSLDDVYLYSPRDPPRNAEETMLLQLNISEKTIEVLYQDFLDHCYPCFSMPLDSFKHYLSNYGLSISDERLKSLFLAFNYKKNGYISFHELLMGLVSLEPTAPHSETRIKFIFRFYDTGCKQHLDMTDFSKLVTDIFPDLEESDLKLKLDEYLIAVGADPNEQENVLISFSNFANAIRTHAIRGTSKLCRSSVPVFLQLTRAFIHRKKLVSNVVGKEWNDLKSIIVSRSYQGIQYSIS